MFFSSCVSTTLPAIWNISVSLNGLNVTYPFSFAKHLSESFLFNTPFLRIIASALELPLQYHDGGDVGPAFGAARLARLAATGEAPETVCTKPPVRQTVEPDKTTTDQMAPRREQFTALYTDLRARFAATSTD